MRPRPGNQRRGAAAVAGRGREAIAPLIDERSSSWCPAACAIRSGSAGAPFSRACQDWLERPRVTGRRHLGPARATVDALAPGGRVLLVDQAVDRDVYEVRIAVVGVAVGEGGIQRRDDQVEVVSRVVAERLQVVPLQDVQRLGQNRPLAPRPAGKHVVAPVSWSPTGSSIFTEKLGEVVVVHEAAVRLAERVDLTGDVALVEEVASGAQAGLAPRSLPPPPRPRSGGGTSSRDPAAVTISPCRSWRPPGEERSIVGAGTCAATAPRSSRCQRGTGGSGSRARHSSRAGATTSANDFVPKFSSAVIQASAAAGVTERGRPGGISPPCCSLK